MFSVWLSKPSSLFRSTFRVASAVSTFRVVITSQFDVQSHHHHFLVSAFRAIIVTFQFGVQSHHRFSDRHSESLLSLTFRVIIVTSRFWRSEPSSLLSISVQSHHYFQSRLGSGSKLESEHHGECSRRPIGSKWKYEPECSAIVSRSRRPRL